MITIETVECFTIGPGGKREDYYIAVAQRDGKPVVRSNPHKTELDARRDVIHNLAK